MPALAPPLLGPVPMTSAPVPLAGAVGPAARARAGRSGPIRSAGMNSPHPRGAGVLARRPAPGSPCSPAPPSALISGFGADRSTGPSRASLISSSPSHACVEGGTGSVECVRGTRLTIDGALGQQHPRALRGASPPRCWSSCSIERAGPSGACPRTEPTRRCRPSCPRGRSDRAKPTVLQTL
jgi:hypothetical protein